MRFDQFIRERCYLLNVSPATVSWYTHAFKWLPNDSPTNEELKAMVVRMREQGLNPGGCNAVIRAVNAYLHWSANPTVKCHPACSHPRLSYLKEEQKIFPTYTADQVKRLLNWKPRHTRFYERRLRLLLMILFDTGCRISESTGIRLSDTDLDNMLVKLDGKGRKQRLVPISMELRKEIYRFTRDFPPAHSEWFLLANREGVRASRRTLWESLGNLCRRLGFDPPPMTCHATRHTFGITYVRRGGSVFHLQKTLGHSTLEMSRRYANVTTEDLQAVHPKVSLLH